MFLLCIYIIDFPFILLIIHIKFIEDICSINTLINFNINFIIIKILPYKSTSKFKLKNTKHKTESKQGERRI